MPAHADKAVRERFFFRLASQNSIFKNIILIENQINQTVNYGAPQTNEALENVSTFIRLKKPIYKHNISKLLGVKKFQELSTREKKLYDICRRSFQRICALKKKK